MPDTANPLRSASPQAWDDLIEAVGPASLLVIIESRMSPPLRRHLSAEDVWQDSLLHAWRDRAKCEWRGIKNFRAWLLTVIDNRIRDAATRLTAQKRGGGAAVARFSSVGAAGGSPSDGDRSHFPGPVGSTTPSRVAIFREQAAAMQAALAALPDDVREVVRLRLFEQLKMEEIAQRLGIGESAVRHRFRRGSEAYAAALRVELASRSTLPPHDPAALGPADRSPT